jgi:hypothetical protein
VPIQAPLDAAEAITDTFVIDLHQFFEVLEPLLNEVLLFIDSSFQSNTPSDDADNGARNVGGGIQVGHGDSY